MRGSAPGPTRGGGGALPCAYLHVCLQGCRIAAPPTPTEHRRPPPQGPIKGEGGCARTFISAFMAAG